MSAGLTIGPSKDSVEALGSAIIAILESSASDQVQIVALETLTDGARVDNIRIEGCTFTLGTDGEDNE